MCALKQVGRSPERPIFIICLLCTIGMFAIRAERDYVQEDDFSKAVRKVAESKKLESKFDYKAQGST